MPNRRFIFETVNEHLANLCQTLRVFCYLLMPPTTHAADDKKTDLLDPIDELGFALFRIFVGSRAKNC